MAIEILRELLGRIYLHPLLPAYQTFQVLLSLHPLGRSSPSNSRLHSITSADHSIEGIGNDVDTWIVLRIM